MSGSNWGRKTTGERPQGTARRSQVVTTFGPGAMMDLLDHAVLLGGLNFWNYDKNSGATTILEPRLRDVLIDRFRARGRDLSIESSFREPPIGDDRDPTRLRGIQALEFPQWHVCQNPKCRALLKTNNLDLKGQKYRHSCTGGTHSETVPVRFVTACKNGHLQEFPWIYFVHAGAEERNCPAPLLKLLEGASGDFSEIFVACVCGARRSLSNALVKEANPPCAGERPWLGPEGRENCTEPMRLMVRTASNSYFPQVVSALSVPDESKALEDAVKEVWDVLKVADKATLPAFRQIPKVQLALANYPDDQVLEIVGSLKSGKTIPREPLRTAEFKQFIAARPEAPGELPPPGSRFFVRKLVPERKLPAFLESIVLAHHLREVRAMVGFTRIESVSADLQGEFDLGVRTQDLGLSTDWVPATEILGEGVFLQLNESAVREWENRPAVIERREQLFQGYEAWKATADEPPPFPGVRFYLLHSLAHLLITALSLEAGYSASSIRERIYCGGAGSPVPMAGILLSTGSTGTDGTLGGLVAQGSRMHVHLAKAWELGRLCSNDPVCGTHAPNGDHAERFLEGAACHGCLFVAECSCERFNRYLDRALVVPTIGHPSETAFLEVKPE